MRHFPCRFCVVALAMTTAMVLSTRAPLWADGMVMRPATYAGSLEERAQEAIIIFNASPPKHEATEDLILKIRVEGAVSQFAWIVPFPNPPTVEKADEALFKELYDYVAFRNQPPRAAKMKGKFAAAGGMGGGMGVEVLSREIVGSYDVAVVREKSRAT